MGKGQEWWRLLARQREGHIQTYTDRILRSGSTVEIEAVKRLVHKALLDDGWFDAKMVRSKKYQWHVCDKFYNYKGISGNHRGYHDLIQRKISSYITLEQAIKKENEAENKEYGSYDTASGLSGGTEPDDSIFTKKSFLPWALIGGALILLVVFFKRKKS